jgi:hypothetical protein
MFSPNNILALAGIEAYEVFAAQNGWRLDPVSAQVISQIAEGRYHGLIRQRARELSIRLRTFQGSQSAVQ